jgi:hypothetical protein
MVSESVGFLVAVKEVLENPLETINGYQSQKQVSFAS